MVGARRGRELSTGGSKQHWKGAEVANEMVGEGGTAPPQESVVRQKGCERGYNGRAGRTSPDVAAEQAAAWAV